MDICDNAMPSCSASTSKRGSSDIFEGVLLNSDTVVLFSRDGTPPTTTQSFTLTSGNLDTVQTVLLTGLQPQGCYSVALSSTSISITPDNTGLFCSSIAGTLLVTSDDLNIHSTSSTIASSQNTASESSPTDSESDKESSVHQVDDSIRNCILSVLQISIIALSCCF